MMDLVFVVHRAGNDTHVMAARKEEEIKKLRNAFGIAEDHAEGEAHKRPLDPENEWQNHSFWVLKMSGTAWSYELRPYVPILRRAFPLSGSLRLMS